MKLKLNEVLNLNQTLKLIIDDPARKIDPLFKFKLLGIMKAIEHPVSNFELIRNEKINEYGSKTDDGNICIPGDDADAIKRFQDDLREVIESEVEVNITKLHAADVFHQGVSAEYLVGLYAIIEGE